MRGASAIQSALQEAAAAPVRAFVVWEPVLPTDWVGVKTAALARIPDPRAAQFWDEGRALSMHLGGPPRFAAPEFKLMFDMGDVVWDLVLIYPPGARWEGGKSKPSFAGGPVYKVMDDVRAALKPR